MGEEGPCKFGHDDAAHQKLYASATEDQYQVDRWASLS